MAVAGQGLSWDLRGGMGLLGANKEASGPGGQSPLCKAGSPVQQMSVIGL